MIDINTIINTAIGSAVDAHITVLRQEYANKMGHMAQQIAALQEELAQLKQQRADSPAPAFTGQEVTALQLCITHETSPVYSAIVNIARSVAVAAAEEVMDEHKDEYSHDEYDRIVNFVDDDLPSEFPDFDDFVRHDDLGSAIEDKLNGASISISL